VDAERRQVTVLFADMVGFTAYSERSGEEAAYTLMRSLSKLMDDAVLEQGGVVQSFTGDGIMAVFDRGSMSHARRDEILRRYALH
jgi:adenylate cyclase